jgi:hypothetical protein
MKYFTIVFLLFYFQSIFEFFGLIKPHWSNNRNLLLEYVQVGSHPVTSINEPPTKHNDPAVLQWSFEGHHDIVGTIIVKCSNTQHTIIHSGASSKSW